MNPALLIMTLVRPAMKRLLMLLCSLALCGAAAYADPLRVGVAPDRPPLAYYDGERIVGVEADSARALGEIIGRPAQLLAMPFDALLEALQAGRIDIIMSGMSYTPERAQQVTFLDPYLQAGQMAIMRIDSVARFGQPWSVFREDTRVGVEAATTGEDWARAELTAAQITPFKDVAAGLAALRAGSIDLFVHDAPTSWLLATSDDYPDLISQYHFLTEEQLAWAVRSDAPALAAELNRALATMRANGTLEYIIDRWIPVTVEVP
jgi:polar amino acid transport system substrate-binding protein